MTAWARRRQSGAERAGDDLDRVARGRGQPAGVLDRGGYVELACLFEGEAGEGGADQRGAGDRRAAAARLEGRAFDAPLGARERELEPVAAGQIFRAPEPVPRRRRADPAGMLKMLL